MVSLLGLSLAVALPYVLLRYSIRDILPRKPLSPHQLPLVSLLGLSHFGE